MQPRRTHRRAESQGRLNCATPEIGVSIGPKVAHSLVLRRDDTKLQSGRAVRRLDYVYCTVIVIWVAE